MIFVVVGSLYPFDRLIKACDQLAAQDVTQQWVAQIQEGSFEPKHMRFERFMDKEAFTKNVEKADLIIGHAGMGLINDALMANKPLLVVPRLRSFGEHVNDHQISGAELFESEGHLLVAKNPSDIGPMLAEAKSFVPTPRQVQAASLVADISSFIATC